MYWTRKTFNFKTKLGGCGFRVFRRLLLLIVFFYSCFVGAESINEPRDSLKSSGFTFSLIKESAEFAPRDGAGLVEKDGVLYLIGGWSQNKPNNFPRVVANDVWAAKVPFENWTLLKPNTYDKNFDSSADFEGRHSAGYLVYKNKIWLLGGDCNSGHYQSDVWNSEDGANWNLVTKDAPFGDRILFHSFVLNDEMWILGGMRCDVYSDSFNNSFFSDAYKSRDGIKWEKVQPIVDAGDLFPAGMVQGYAKLNGYIYIISGGYYGSYVGPRQFRNDVYRS